MRMQVFVFSHILYYGELSFKMEKDCSMLQKNLENLDFLFYMNQDESSYLQLQRFYFLCESAMFGFRPLMRRSLSGTYYI